MSAMSGGDAASNSGDYVDGHDLRGWCMRRGHRRRLFNRKRPAGRTCFARSINPRPRPEKSRYCAQRRRLAKALTCESQVNGHVADARDDWSWEREAWCDLDESSTLWESSEVCDVSSVCVVLHTATVETRCWLCSVEANPLPPHACAFCRGLRQSVSRWDRAVARAESTAVEFLRRGHLTKLAGHAAAKQPKKKTASWNFNDLRKAFLASFEGHIRDALSGTLGSATTLEPAPVAEDVANRFMTACGRTTRLPANLIPVFHGTNAGNHHSIFSRGLLIPSNNNGVSVVHGAAYGCGIYTTTGGSIQTSRFYCSEPKMLVCGLLDNSDPARVGQHSWGRVIFDDRIVVPLFEAVGAGEILKRVVQPVDAGAAGVASSLMASAAARRVSGGVLRLRQLMSRAPLRRSDHKPPMSKIASAIVEKVSAFFGRRAARRRSLRKRPSVQSVQKCSS